MNKAVLWAAYFLLLFIVITFAATHSEYPDEITKTLCKEYAVRDHEKEIARERWLWFTERGINPNTDYDWYQSCINHNAKAVAHRLHQR